MTIKAFALIRRHPQSDWYGFRDYFRGDFLKAILATEAGGAISRIVTNHVLEPNFRPTTNADNHIWSALAEYYFDDEAAAIRTVRDPEFLAAATERPDMVAEISHSVVEEILVHDSLPRAGAPKVYGFFKIVLPPNNPVTRGEMRVRLFDHIDHMKELPTVGKVMRLVQNLTLLDFHTVNPRYDYDGCSLVWFDSVEDGESIYKSYEAEQAILPSTAPMGADAGCCVYLRTDEMESYVRA